MFCAQCGTKFEDGAFRCGNCGWEPAKKLESVQAETPAAPVKAPIPEVKPQVVQHNPVAQPAVNPAVQPAVNPAVQPAANPAGQQPYTAVNQPAAKPKKKKTGLIIAVVLIVFVLIFGGLAALVGVVIYRNTDTYKVKETVTLIEEGDTDGAYSMISDVYTDEAMAIKVFLELEADKSAFDDAMTGMYASTYDPEDATVEFYDFISAVNSFETDYYYNYLPESLKERYNGYKAAAKFTDEFVYGETTDYYTEYTEDCLYDYFCDVQVVMLNDVFRNDSSQFGYTFTLRQLQERVDTSNAALEELDGYDFKSLELSGDVLTYCPALWLYPEISIGISTHAQSVINDLIYECESEISANQTLINGGLEKFEADDDLYISDANPYYTAYVGDYLQSLSAESDIYVNADEIITMLRVEILYALINGEAVAA